MKPMTLAFVAVALVASPAFALKITNLDTVPHRVELSGRGESQVRLIQPNATEFFAGASQGFLALLNDTESVVSGSAITDKKLRSRKSKLSAKRTEKTDSVVHADGMLSGVIGNERTSGIPADPENFYVIWPGGKIALQGRRKTTRGR